MKYLEAIKDKVNNLLKVSKGSMKISEDLFHVEFYYAKVNSVVNIRTTDEDLRDINTEVLIVEITPNEGIKKTAPYVIDLNNKKYTVNMIYCDILSFIENFSNEEYMKKNFTSAEDNLNAVENMPDYAKTVAERVLKSMNILS